MKIPFFVALLVLLALSAPCWSQETAKPNLAFDSTTMKYIWRETVPVDSVGKAELYQRAAQWVALMYKDSKRATRYDDKDAGVLIARGYWQKTFAQHWYTLRIECKDGRYRATLTDFTMVTTLSGQRTESEVEDMHRKYRAKYVEDCVETLAALRKAMALPAASGEGW